MALYIVFFLIAFVSILVLIWPEGGDLDEVYRREEAMAALKRLVDHQGQE